MSSSDKVSDESLKFCVFVRQGGNSEFTGCALHVKDGVSTGNLIVCQLKVF